MKIVLVAAARPNFMKIAPLMRAIQQHNASSPSNPIQPLLVHTGQHYDYKMSQVFFEELGIPSPGIHLGIGSGTHAEQTGNVLIEFERLLLREKPGLVLVVGDVNSTLAASLAAVKIHIPVAHVEAGLRSFDKEMPEEINRMLTDAISDYLFTPSPDADQNLINEGIPKERIFCVGDIMVDSLLYNLAKAERSEVLSALNLSKKGYALLTLHRPSNVDDKASFLQILDALEEIGGHIQVVFPAHPRTNKMITQHGLHSRLAGLANRIKVIEPVGYLDFLNLQMNCRFVMTDSGGIQEETTVLNIPCLTLRNTTERPITIAEGTNTLVWGSSRKIAAEAMKIIEGKYKKGGCPENWDGKTAERVVKIITRYTR